MCIIGLFSGDVGSKLIIKNLRVMLPCDGRVYCVHERSMILRNALCQGRQSPWFQAPRWLLRAAFAREKRTFNARRLLRPSTRVPMLFRDPGRVIRPRGRRKLIETRIE